MFLVVNSSEVFQRFGTKPDKVKMKLWQVVAFMFCFLLPKALSLTCFKCHSTLSWEGCRPTSKTCHPDYDRCAKVYVKGSDGEVFSKSCIPTSWCKKDANPYCKKAAGSSSYQCDIQCCCGDDCNAGSTMHSSGMLLLTCALASLTIVKV